MTFRIVLTVLLALSSLLDLDSIDKSSKPRKGGAALIHLALTAVLIYGIWNWL